MNIGEKIKLLRKQKDVTQEQMGKTLNIAKSTISQYENNINTPDATMLNKIANYFNVSVDYLLGRTDIKNPYQNKDKVSNALIDDPELAEFWDELQDRESLQLMFKQVKDLDDKSIKQVMRIIKAIEDEEGKE